MLLPGGEGHRVALGVCAVGVVLRVGDGDLAGLRIAVHVDVEHHRQGRDVGRDGKEDEGRLIGLRRAFRLGQHERIGEGSRDAGVALARGGNGALPFAFFDFGCDRAAQHGGAE
ncbi:MAG: hypothetical protein J6Q22_05455, partial [Prevotella sp.]|nr:hypothetical protein [Prevotella sp.]